MAANDCLGPAPGQSQFFSSDRRAAFLPLALCSSIRHAVAERRRRITTAIYRRANRLILADTDWPRKLPPAYCGARATPPLLASRSIDANT